MKSNDLKIGIVTFHRALNYGANLQAFALNSYVNQMGYDCEIIDLYPNNVGRPSKKFVRRLLGSAKRVLLSYKDKKFRRFNKFQKDNYKLSLSKYYGDDDMAEASLQYSVLISGSDQILNTTLTGNTKSYYLSFDNKAKKISYGSSFGRSELSETEFVLIDSELVKFSSLSVREKSGQDIIMQRIGVQSTLVLDPVFLLSKEKWEQKTAKRTLPPKYILLYAMEATELLKNAARAMSERLALPVYVIYGCAKRFEEFGITIEDCGPVEFLSYIRGASVVVTNSFHGTAFSIIFEKNFVCVAHSTRNARLENIMEIIGRQEKLLKQKTDEPEIVDGKEAAIVLAPHIQISKDYLESALEFQ